MFFLIASSLFFVCSIFDWFLAFPDIPFLDFLSLLFSPSSFLSCLRSFFFPVSVFLFLFFYLMFLFFFHRRFCVSSFCCNSFFSFFLFLISLFFSHFFLFFFSNSVSVFLPTKFSKLSVVNFLKTKLCLFSQHPFFNV